MTGFDMMATLVFNELIRFTEPLLKPSFISKCQGPIKKKIKYFHYGNAFVFSLFYIKYC